MMRVIVTMVLAAVIALPAQAELMIRITEGADNAIPVAVVPFGKADGFQPSENISQIIHEDLAMSGEFKPLPSERMLSLPTNGDDVFYRDWRLLGQKYLLVGQVQPAGGNKVSARYELFDVNREKRIMGETASVAADNLRTLAHHISDKVYEAITGTRGVFSTRIAYVTLDMENGKRIYRLNVSDVDGKRASVRLKSKEPILSPAWSPDGRRLAYVSFETGRPAIYIQELATGKRTRIAQFPGLNSAPAWSPDGDSLLMTLSRDGNAEIYKMDVASRKLTRMTDHWAIDTEPDWAPDGNSFVFTSDRSGGPQVYRMDADGGDLSRLTFGSRYNARPRFSPDGENIFYVHQRDSYFHIARMNIESGEETILTRTKLDESPSVAPNGRLLIYATQEGGKSVLAVISADGGSNYILPSRFGDVREPAWSPFLN
ncbi:Tol-Pal system protein TolB [Marinobacter halodurans]|uniref:Tol-Pal system protein TolB n=1 Tax=Marinobacter halodurans TaxID=2528979 RepID=A0ABY1ZJE1_9GAMM|nr:Tol-Pal system beta propeller repeat protein TolB [Marinobacter halodurans]TBW54664.1 Tol-Pal system protein TolB [Marinobacter halodurans]